MTLVPQLDRRSFVKAIPAVGITSLVVPTLAAESTSGIAQQGGNAQTPQRVTREMMRATEQLIGIELKPEAGGAKKYCKKLKDEGILCKESHDHVIRIAPPIIRR